MNPHDHTTNVLGLLGQITADGCEEIPFVADATQTYFNYLNGAAGYIVFIIGAALLLVSMVSKKQLSKLPGWMAGLLIAALALGSLPILLNAFGVNLGCGGGTPPAAEAPADDGEG
ncbi:MAG: hypothetical protein AAF962_18930 [Actinomycetota bacterium]